MKNIITIVRRDLAAYFTSPVGYIFMIVFLLIGVGLYITSFFTYPVADMRNFFSNLPVLLCVFVPAVTMRVWAEERKENTWEMLLTFPMKAYELVLGKFFATLVFYAVTLAGTVTVPAMLFALGDPDNGAVLSGYLGALLLGALFLAIGIFVSGLCKDQIVAFVVAFLVCFLVFLVGTNFMASYLDGLFGEDSLLSNLGTLLSQLVGLVDHFTSFTRGVIDVADVTYFLAWTALFLMLNILYIDGRNRKGAKAAFSGAVALSIGIGLAFNWIIIDQSFGRFDLTEDKVYTVSPASASILSRLDKPVKVNLYITRKDKMPTGMTTLEQDVLDKLNEIRLASNGKIEYTAIYLDVANLADPMKEMAKKEEEKDKEKSVEQRMLDKGIQPFAVRAIGQDQVTSKYVYSSLGVAYKDKEEEIIPQIMPENLPELEYRLVSTVFKLTREKQPVVALVAPKDSMSPEMRAMYMQMGQMPPANDPFDYLEEALRLEKYDVRRVELTKESPLPDEYDTLVVLYPRALDDRQRWEISRAIASGKPTFIGVQNYQWNYQTTRSGLSVTKQEQEPKINPLLEKYGLGVSEDVLLDTNKIALSMGARSLADLLAGPQSVNLPIQILVNATSMASDVSITSRLANILYMWGSPLTIDADALKRHNLESKVLIQSSKQAWTTPGSASASELNAALERASGTEQFPLMVMVTGQFPDAFKDQPRPAWAPARPMPGQPPMPETGEDKPETPLTPAPGKLILIGCAEMFSKSFLQGGNLDLFLNSVDAITLGDELVNVRGQKPVDRTISATEHQRSVWKAVNYALVPVIVALTGIIVTALRRRARNAYTVRFADQD